MTDIKKIDIIKNQFLSATQEVKAMEKNVIISIQGLQSYEGSDDDRIELVTEGQLADHGEGGLILSYQESELTGMEGTETLLHMDPDGTVTLLRTGQFNSQMIFQQGRRHLSLYQTPYGDMAIGVLADRVRNTMSMNGGELEIAYAIEIDNAVAGRSLFKVQVREDTRPRRGCLPQ